MLSTNFKPKRTLAASRGFLATAQFSCLKYHLVKYTRTINCALEPILTKNYDNPNTGRKAGDATYDEYSRHIWYIYWFIRRTSCGTYTNVRSWEDCWMAWKYWTKWCGMSVNCIATWAAINSWTNTQSRLTSQCRRLLTPQIFTRARNWPRLASAHPGRPHIGHCPIFIVLNLILIVRFY